MSGLCGIAARIVLGVELVAGDTGHRLDVDQPVQRQAACPQPFGHGLLRERNAGTLRERLGKLFLRAGNSNGFANGGYAYGHTR